MLFLTKLFFLGFFNGCFGQNQIPPEKQALIDELIETYRSTNNIPGFGLSLVKDNGEIMYTRGYGRSNLETNTTADSLTLYAIGSITKVRDSS